MKTPGRIFTLFLLAFSSSSFAIPLATVGGADSLQAWDKLGNSGSATEQQFIADHLGVASASITYTQLSNSGGSAWMQVDEDASLWAFDFGALTPALFIVKTGAKVGLAGETGTFTHFLFENLANSRYAVIDFDLFTRTRGGLEIGMVSHVGVSGNTSVPEPAALALMSLGLLGLGASRRRTGRR